MIAERVEALIAQITEGGLARPEALKGCTEAEVEKLQAKYDVRLPAAYREFLLRMGKSAGNFMGSEFNASYRDVLKMTRNQRRTIAESKEEWKAELEDALCEGILVKDVNVPAWAYFDLPDSALIIWSRHDEQFWFILCDPTETKPAEDTAVYYFSHQDDLDTAGKVFDSLFDFWQMIYNDAIAAHQSRTKPAGA